MRVVLLPIYYKNENRIETCQIFIRDSEELCILDIDRDSGLNAMKPTLSLRRL